MRFSHTKPAWPSSQDMGHSEKRGLLNQKAGRVPVHRSHRREKSPEESGSSTSLPCALAVSMFQEAAQPEPNLLPVWGCLVPIFRSFSTSLLLLTFLRVPFYRKFLFFLWGDPLQTPSQNPAPQVAFPLLKIVVLKPQREGVSGGVGWAGRKHENKKQCRFALLSAGLAFLSAVFARKRERERERERERLKFSGNPLRAVP